MTRQQSDRFAIGRERGRPVTPRQIEIAAIGMIAGEKAMVWPQQCSDVLADFGCSPDQRLGRFRSAHLEVDIRQLIERHGGRGTVGSVHLLADGDGGAVVFFGGWQITGGLRDEAQRVVVDGGLLVLGPEITDYEWGGALVKRRDCAKSPLL